MVYIKLNLIFNIGLQILMAYSPQGSSYQPQKGS